MPSARNTALNPQTTRRTATQFEPGVKDLLDHIAIELAAEYVRLMAAAAEAEDHSPPHDD